MSTGVFLFCDVSCDVMCICDVSCIHAFFRKDKDKDRPMRQINVKALKKRAEVEGQVWQAGKTNAFCEWRSGGCKMEDGENTNLRIFQGTTNSSGSNPIPWLDAAFS